MEGIEDKLDYIISIEPKRHKELLAELRREQVPPVVHVDLSSVISANNEIIAQVKKLLSENTSKSTLEQLAAAIKENNQILRQIAEHEEKPEPKKEYHFEIKRNKFSDLIESVSVKEK